MTEKTNMKIGWKIRTIFGFEFLENAVMEATISVS